MDELADRRRELGAWYTPPELVAHVVARTVPVSPRGRIVVLDPACGDGRFLVEAARVVRERGGDPVLVGIDVDPTAVDAARRRPELCDAQLVCADALASNTAWPTNVDVVVGNPPFLSPLSTRVSKAVRSGGTVSPAGAYADVAVRFLDLSRRAVRRDGGRIGLVLPVSVLASRDAQPVRAALVDDGEMQWFWWSRSPVFDAAVITCAVGFERTRSPQRDHLVERHAGIDMSPSSAVAQPRADDLGWGDLIADELGVPAVDDLHVAGSVGDRCVVTADFRDQYYGVLDALVDLDLDLAVRPHDGVAPLVTTAHVDPGRCRWGDVPVRYGKRRWRAPGVALAELDDRTLRWARSRLVPKVLVATQTAVIEAVADPVGRWLPAVPVISLTPRPPSDVDEIAAVLTSPVPSALAARRAAGTGMSSRVVRITARHLASLPWPAGPLDLAVAALRAGRLDECGRAVSAAYGLTDGADDELHTWWAARLRR